MADKGAFGEPSLVRSFLPMKFIAIQENSQKKEEAHRTYRNGLSASNTHAGVLSAHTDATLTAAFSRLLEVKLVRLSGSEDVPKIFRPCESVVDRIYKKWVLLAALDFLKRGGGFLLWAHGTTKAWLSNSSGPCRGSRPTGEGHREAAAVQPTETTPGGYSDLDSEVVADVRAIACNDGQDSLSSFSFLSKKPGALSLGTLVSHGSKSGMQRR